ncbi:hypothetical protein A6R68_16944 [Neotoma lepida]|uniref:Interleukin-12 receptor subunit beta-1 n=1 Tax=Neotoma lepida TaxID=56216 RepID=A0A1A6HDC8_NEOLE|nr:hypothetical protein A6R68_16944 [Neotoma lepida]
MKRVPVTGVRKPIPIVSVFRGGDKVAGPFVGAEVPGASRLLVDLMWLRGISLHILIFLLLCRLGASCRAGSCCFEKLPLYSDGASGPRNLSCYRVSGAEYECSWQYDGSEDNVTHFLRCCFGGGRCCYFPAGRSRTVQFSEQAGVPVLSNVTFWVETRLSNWTVKSLAISLYLSNWAKVNPPLGDIKVSHSEGQLRLDWNVSDEVQAEAQFRRRTPTTNWTLGDCGLQDKSGLGVIEDIHGSSSEPFPQPEVKFQLKTSRTVSLGKTLKLSGAAYDLVVVTKSRFGLSPNQTWHRIPAQNLSELPPEMRTLNVSVEGNVTSMHWAAQGPDTTYCVEWQAQGQGRNRTHCTLIAPEDGDPARMVTHSWSSEPALDREECYRVAVFASKNPEKPLLWSTVLSSYYFEGDTSVAGTPRHVSVRIHSGDSVSVEWAPSRLSACPGVLTRYVVRCEAEDGEWASAEWPVPPAKTQVTLRGLRSGVVYKVRVRADTARLPGAWSRPQPFSFEVQISRLSIIFASLGSFASVLLVGGLGYVGLSR